MQQFNCGSCANEGREVSCLVCEAGATHGSELAPIAHVGAFINAKPSNPKDACGITKAPMSTVPANVLAEIGVAMLDGAGKYGRHNYRAVGVRASVYYDAILRHLFSWWEGEDLDPDSGLPHLVKLLSSAVVLRDAIYQGKCQDDRPPRSEGFYGHLNVIAKQLVERDAGKDVTHYTQEGA